MADSVQPIHTPDRPSWPARSVTVLALSAALLATAAAGRGRIGRDWPVYGGDPGGNRYSALTQIDRSNVHRLEVAWTYRSGDALPDGGSQIQTNPIVVDGVLYATTPGLKAFALRAATGEELWRFDPFAGRKRENHANRGVVYWSSGRDRRILFTAGSRLFALDAGTGRPVPGFGRGGFVDLREGLERDTAGLYVIGTTPGVVYRDLLIQGTRVSEGEDAAPGDVRAYDIRTGAVRWIFRTIPGPGEFGADTWPTDARTASGGANSWAGMTLDARRGVVFVPTGSPSFDFYGGDRPGQNLFGNSVLALDAATGRRIWHFQTVHHDLWDRDLPAPPNLVTLRRDGRRVDAAAQITKSGFVFVLDRRTGRPLFPVEERPVPASDLRGESAWPTQPIPTRPAPFARQLLTEDSLTDISPQARAFALERFRSMRGGHLFAPPSLEGTIVFPGFDGGGEWGGAAFDASTGIMYVNASDVPWIARMVEKEPAAARVDARAGNEVYGASCASCHGADRRGDGGRSPSLIGVGDRLSDAEIRQLLLRGRGFMPAFAQLPEAERDAVIAYLTGRAAPAASPGAPARTDRSRVPYRFGGYHRFVDQEGYPAVKPPWGTLNAIDLNTGEIVWKVTLGEYPELTARGVPPTGTENYGGPVVTAGGLVFIAATRDEKIRAFDKETGKLLWQADLPAAGYATPAVYEAGGRQFVVIAAGGGKLGTRSSDSYVAFALPD